LTLEPNLAPFSIGNGYFLSQLSAQPFGVRKSNFLSAFIKSITYNMPTRNDPLLLWCSSHHTLAAEEIPLLLEAGFRVVPLLTNFWTQQLDPTLNDSICPDWRASVALPQETIRGLQSISFCQSDGRVPFSQPELQLLADHVDAIYVTVYPNVAVRLAAVYPRTVIFRAFGQSSITTYSKTCEWYGVPMSDVSPRPNFIWCPILSTLQEPEDDRLCHNPQHLRAFVTPDRLGSARWSPEASEPFVVDTIPRLKEEYYRKIYDRYVSDHGYLPLKILGGNSPGGGEIADPRIIGRLTDDHYFATAARARISIYHGTSPYHVHYHPIEFMTLGVPVLFHRASAFAAEARHIGYGETALAEAGMYADATEANRVAEAALADASLAAAIADKQRFFIERIFSRKAALEQAIWLRTLVAQRMKKPVAIGSGGNPPVIERKRRRFLRSLRWPKKLSRSV
jgi:hypothetical protein